MNRREQLRHTTLTNLREQELGTSPSEFRSLWNVVMSQLDASVSRLLAAD